MPSKRFAIRSNRVCLGSDVVPATIEISEEKVAAVHRGDVKLSVDCEDFGNLVIMPGIIDAHVHINEPGRTDWEGFESATKAAIAGGVTTVVDMPLNSDPVTTTAEAFAEKCVASASKCWCDVGFYGGVVPDNQRELRGLIDAGVLGLKAFLCDSGLEEFLAAGELELRGALQELRREQIPLLVHAELVFDESTTITDSRAYWQHMLSRPDQWELNAIELLIKLCDEYQSPIHIVHLSTALAVERLLAAKSQSMPLTVETCPHYLLFAAERIEDGDTRFKCAPPIRSESNRLALLAALDELIDTVGSDHSPCPPEMKALDNGSFPHAWGGIASIQLTLPALWTAVRDHGVSVDRVSAWLSANPARLLGIGERKGRIEPGYDADLCIWDPEQQWVVDGQSLLHRHKVTPYDGHNLYGQVKKTYLRGERIDLDDDAKGELIFRR